jgi:hypothetical protein
VLLFVFTISTVPKIYIHAILADHKDFENSCSHTTHKTACIKTAGINCHFNDLVVNLPYLYEHVEIVPGTITHSQRLIINEPSFTFQKCALSKKVRGPPAA